MLKKMLFFFLLTLFFQKEGFSAPYQFSKLAKNTLSEMIEHNASLEYPLDNPDFIFFKVFEEKKTKDEKNTRKIIFIYNNKVLPSVLHNKLPTFYLSQKDASWMGRFFKKGFSTFKKWFTPEVAGPLVFFGFMEATYLKNRLDTINEKAGLFIIPFTDDKFTWFQFLYMFFPVLHGVRNGIQEAVFFPLPYDKNSLHFSQEIVLIVTPKAVPVIEKNLIAKNFQEIAF